MFPSMGEVHFSEIRLRYRYTVTCKLNKELIEIKGETIPYKKVIVQGPVDFLRLVVLSVLIGLFFGVIATLITKN